MMWPRIVVWVIASALVALAALLALAQVGFIVPDDAFILMVYARHFSESGSFYWNLGDGAVDGFTSMLDLLIKSAGIKLLATDEIQTFWRITLLYHVAAALTGFLLCALLARRMRFPHRALLALAGGLAVATSRSLAQGSGFLLETPLFVLLALWSTYLTLFHEDLSRPILVLWSLLLIALPLARPEGLPLALCLLVLFLWERRGRLSRGGLVFPGALAVAALALYYLWRIRVFGHWAPNTFYAKSSASSLVELADGLSYLARFVSSAQGSIQALVLLAALLLALPRWPDAGSRRKYVLLLLITLALIAIAVLAGGDCWPGSRFLAAPVAFLPVALVLAAAHLEGMYRLVPRGLLALVVLLQIVPIVQHPHETRIDSVTSGREYSLERFGCDREFVRALASALPQGARIAQSDFQRFKFFSDESQVVDLHGLNDRRIAHERWDGRVGWGKFRHATGIRENAEIWIYGHRIYSPKGAPPMAAFTMREILTNPRLYRGFIYAGADPPAPTAAEIEQICHAYLPASFAVCGGHVNFLVRKDIALAVASASGFLVGGS